MNKGYSNSRVVVVVLVANVSSSSAVVVVEAVEAAPTEVAAPATVTGV